MTDSIEVNDHRKGDDQQREQNGSEREEAVGLPHGERIASESEEVVVCERHLKIENRLLPFLSLRK